MIEQKTLEQLMQFGFVLLELRKAFPEHAKEIDRCLFNTKMKYLPQCQSAKCECKQSFEDFHKEQNEYFQKSPKQNYEFN